MGTLKIDGSVNIQDLLTLKSGTSAYTTPSIAFGTDALIGYGSIVKNLGIYSSNKIYFRPNNGALGYSDGIELSTTSLIPTKNNTVALGDSTHKWSNIYATTFIGALSGTASKATNLTATDGSTDVERKILVTTEATSGQNTYCVPGVTANYAKKTLTAAGGFIGNLTGNADTATISTYLKTSAGTNNSARHVYFAHNGDAVGKQRVAIDNDFKYNPSTNVLTVGRISGQATYVRDSYNGSNITITYGKPGQSSTSLLASWNGYELGAISPSNIIAGWASGANYSDSSNALASTGWGNNNFTYLQTDKDFYGNSGWSHYLISNHGYGATYYNYVISLPFWSYPKYKRLSEGIAGSWYNFHTTENVIIQNATPGAGFYGQIWFKI